jgi:hypothetical protein
MLYFGADQTVPGEQGSYVNHLKFFQHLLIGIQTLQHRGCMVLKVDDTFNNLTVSLMLLISRLFDSVLLGKPLASSPLNQTQYFVCSGRGAIINDLI